LRIPVFVLLLAISCTPVRADDFKALPAGPGRNVTVKVCSQCHSPELVANQKLDRGGWTSLVGQMASNGAQANDGEFDLIIKYLSDSFPSQ
jgi:mono/diheme cytochrome c family protein